MSQMLSKSDFAKLIKVSAARVTQLISEGKISGAALEGEGRKAKIVVDVALDQLKLRRDVGQSLGNGAKTNLNPDAPNEETGSTSVATASAPRAKTKADEYAEEQQYLKLQAARRKERREQEADLLDQNLLMKREDAEQATDVIMGIVIDALTGHPDRLGDDLAAKFEIKDKRGLVFFLRQSFRDLRHQISDMLDRRAEDEPEYVLADLIKVRGDDDGAMGESITESEPTGSEEDETNCPDRYERVGKE